MSGSLIHPIPSFGGWQTSGRGWSPVGRRSTSEDWEWGGDKSGWSGMEARWWGLCWKSTSWVWILDLSSRLCKPTGQRGGPEITWRSKAVCDTGRRQGRSLADTRVWNQERWAHYTRWLEAEISTRSSPGHVGELSWGGPQDQCWRSPWGSWESVPSTTMLRSGELSSARSGAAASTNAQVWRGGEISGVASPERLS